MIEEIMAARGGSPYPVLTKYGLSGFFLPEILERPDLTPARVVSQSRDLYNIIGESGEAVAGVSGKLAYNAADLLDFPAVGDFVLADWRPGSAVIRRVLRRKSVFTRVAAGKTPDNQVIAANIDTVFICASLNQDFNLRRLERYLTVAWDSGAAPVIVLTKADLSPGADSRTAAASVAAGADVIVCSSETAGGLKSLEPYIRPGKTVAFIGSSGVGKSTIVNRLLGAGVLITKQTREGDDKGRHATTQRRLFLLPCGGIVIDTPGMRELSIAAGDVTKAFEDIEELAARCKYNDCSHASEPGCAVKRAITKGELTQERFENYLKLQRETAYNGLNSRQLENEKINRMFGSKAEMKRALKSFKSGR